jgi:hypothetical protein
MVYAADREARCAAAGEAGLHEMALVLPRAWTDEAQVTTQQFHSWGSSSRLVRRRKRPT